MRYVTREEWGSRQPDYITHLDPRRVDRIFIHHTTGAQQSDKTAWLRSIQRFHMETRRWSDIAYNLLVDADGVCYMGRGLGRVGGHTKGWNSRSVAIAYLGDGSTDVPAAATRAIRRAVEDCDLWFDRELPVFGHRDVGNTACPGDVLYGWLRAGMPVDDPLPPPQPRPLPLHDDDPLRQRDDAPPHLLGQDSVGSPRSVADLGRVITRTPSGSAATGDLRASDSPIPDVRDGWRRHLARMRSRRR